MTGEDLRMSLQPYPTIADRMLPEPLPVTAAGSLAGDILGGVIGGLVTASVIGAVTLGFSWWRRPLLKASWNLIPVNWSPGGMAVLWINVVNGGRSPAREVELEATVPGQLLPRVEGREPVRFDLQGKEYVFVAQLVEALYPASEQTVLKIVFNHNMGTPLPTGEFELPVIIRAANAGEAAHAVCFTLPGPSE